MPHQDQKIKTKSATFRHVFPESERPQFKNCKSYPSESVTRIGGDLSDRSDLAIGECGDARLSRLLLLDLGWPCMANNAWGENMWAPGPPGGDEAWWCKSMGNLRPGGAVSPREARAATAAAAICCWCPSACGMTWLVHSTSFLSSSMSRFNFARLFWNQVMTWNERNSFWDYNIDFEMAFEWIRKLWHSLHARRYKTITSYGSNEAL